MLVTQVNCEFVSVQAAAVFADLTVQLQLLVCAFGLEAVIFRAACEAIVSHTVAHFSMLGLHADKSLTLGYDYVA